MLTVQNWRVTTPEGGEWLGYQGENLVSRLEVRGDIGPEWEVKLDLRRDGRVDIFALERQGDTLYVDVTREMLWGNGVYTAQLRGLAGDKIKNSNLFFLHVGKSVNATEGFPPAVPSELIQVERRLKDYVRAAQEAAQRAETAGGNVSTNLAFEVDPAEGTLSMVTEEHYTGPVFSLNGSDLEVEVNG